MKAPYTNYKSLEDISRFNMMWGVSLLLLPIFLFLVVMHFYFGDQGWITALIASGVSALNLIILKKSLKYKVVTIYSVVGSVIMCQVLVFYIQDSTIVADIMWSVLISFFAFFMLGPVSGTLVLLINITGILLFFNQATPEEIDQRQFDVHTVNLSKIINVYYVGIALCMLFTRIINNQRKVNQQYEGELARSETLLKEIHHRVKNNLQIISSLLKLQAAEVGHQEVREHFDEAIGRIRSMALIHEKMYGIDDSAHVDITSYLHSLSNEIVDSLQFEEMVQFEVESDLARMDIKSLVPISLIFNELITNSLKHAFSERTGGNIFVKIERKGEEVVFTYSDNGTWKPPKSESTFGMELIKTLTAQLDGKCEREINNGTRFTFVFDSNQLFFTEKD